MVERKTPMATTKKKSQGLEVTGWGIEKRKKKVKEETTSAARSTGYEIRKMRQEGGEISDIALQPLLYLLYTATKIDSGASIGMNVRYHSRHKTASLI
jgi:hypothetical protein